MTSTPTIPPVQAKPVRAKPLIAGPKPDAPSQAQLEPGLYIVATPIGNLGDLTPRALHVLLNADQIYAEDKRVTGNLLRLHGHSKAMRSYHEHNSETTRPQILAALAQQKSVALVSDAGTPLICDPGFKLVREARLAGHRIIPVPGASALLAALVSSGLPSDRFFFAGFTPSRQAARRAFFRELAMIPGTLICFETGPRLAASLADAHASLGDRPACVARELTKKFEETRCERLETLAKHYSEAPIAKGEIVLLISGEPALQQQSDELAAQSQRLDQALKSRLPEQSLKEAVAQIAVETHLPRKQVYRRALELRASQAEHHAATPIRPEPDKD